MNREQAINIIMKTIENDDIVISTTGLVSREIYEKFDSKRNIYVPGSMGLVSSIGLGIALSQPSKKVVVLDGDSSLLMNLGSIVTIGKNKARNLLHIVLDNNAYGSCSEEKSMSDNANLDKMAQVAGYQRVKKVDSQKGLKYAILDNKDNLGFILAVIELGGRRDFDRPLQLPEIKNRFIAFLKND